MLEFNINHNFILNMFVSLAILIAFVKTNIKYRQTKDLKYFVISTGLLLGCYFEVVHSISSFIYTYISHIKNYVFQEFTFLNLSNICIAASIFSAIFITSKPDTINEKKLKNNIVIYSVFLSLTVTVLVLLTSKFMPFEFNSFSNKLIVSNPAVEITANTLFILAAFILVDIKLINKEKIWSPTILSLFLMGFGQLYVYSQAYETSLYRYYIHFLKVVSVILFSTNLEVFNFKNTISKFKYKIVAYLTLTLIIFQLVFIALIQILFNIILPVKSQYLFLLLFLLTIYIEFNLAKVLTAQINNAIQYIKNLQPECKPKEIPIISNDEIGMLISQINDSANMIWENNINLIEKQNQIKTLYNNTKKHAEQEILLRKITDNIRNSLDIKEIKANIVQEVGKAFNADKCLIIEFDALKKKYIPLKADALTYNNYKDTDGFNINSIIKFDGKDIIFEPEYIKKYSIKSYYAIPLLYSEKLLGQLIIIYTQNEFLFEPEDKPLIQKLSEQVGVALFQAKLYEKEKQTAKRERLLRKIISLSKDNCDIHMLLNIIAREIAITFNVDVVDIINFKTKAEPAFVIAEYKKNKTPNNIDINLETKDFLMEFICGQISIIKMDNSTLDMLPDYVIDNYQSQNIKSMIGIPLLLPKNKCSGLFLYKYQNSEEWSESDIYFLELIVKYISIAIKESNLYNQAQFLSNISHELKTPVAIIHGYTEALLNKNEYNKDKSKDFLQIIKNNTNRMINIIDNLLYISTIEKNIESEKLLFKKIEVKKVIESSLLLCKEKIESKNIKIEFECEDSIFFNVNELLMQQAIINLLNNAIHYSNEKTLITINTKTKNNEIKINITDQGCGIKEEDIPNIFERFYRADKSRSRKTGGTGLGLSIVKTIIEIHDGYITVDSTYQEGSTFTIHLKSI